MAACRRVLSALLAAVLAVPVFVALNVSTDRGSRAAASSLTFNQRAVQVAAAQKGDPYRYGADGPDAFDCSGLTSYVFRRLGVSLPHNAAQQYQRVRHVAKSNRKPGDLIFMNTSGGGTSGISHVGVYAGHGSWWVARHSGTTVTKQKLWTGRYWVGRVRQ